MSSQYNPILLKDQLNVYRIHYHYQLTCEIFLSSLKGNVEHYIFSLNPHWHKGNIASKSSYSILYIGFSYNLKKFCWFWISSYALKQYQHVLHYWKIHLCWHKSWSFRYVWSNNVFIQFYNLSRTITVLASFFKVGLSRLRKFLPT